MKNKIKKEMQRQELADYLEQLATALRQGNFETADHRWSIPDKLQAKFAEPEWQAAMDEHIDHLGTLKQAVEQTNTKSSSMKFGI